MCIIEHCYIVISGATRGFQGFQGFQMYRYIKYRQQLRWLNITIVQITGEMHSLITAYFRMIVQRLYGDYLDQLIG